MMTMLLFSGCYKSAGSKDDGLDAGVVDRDTSASADLDSDTDSDPDTDTDKDTNTDTNTDTDTDKDTDTTSDVDTDTDTMTTACIPAATLVCDSSVYGNNNAVGATENIENYGCLPPAGETAAEFTYSFIPVETMTVTINLTGMYGDLDLFLLKDLGSGCDPEQCIAFGYNSGYSPEEITFLAEAGTTYYIVVDTCTAGSRCDDDMPGWSLTSYNISVSCIDEIDAGTKSDAGTAASTDSGMENDQDLGTVQGRLEVWETFYQGEEAGCDQYCEILSSAAVTATAEDVSQFGPIQTNKNGWYVFNLPAGNYSIEAIPNPLGDLEPQTKTGVIVVEGETTVQHFNWDLGVDDICD